MSFAKPWGNYLLDGIKETRAPEHISFWPETIAWQVIFTLLLIFTIKKAYQRWKKYRNNAYRREALAWLKQCSLTEENDIRQLPALLRKTALLANEVSRKNNDSPMQDPEFFSKRQQDITLLSGEAWAVWLDKHCLNSDFMQQSDSVPSLQLLVDLAYMPTIDMSDDKVNAALQRLCCQIEIWINDHHLMASGKTPPKAEQS